MACRKAFSAGHFLLNLLIKSFQPSNTRKGRDSSVRENRWQWLFVLGIILLLLTILYVCLLIKPLWNPILGFAKAAFIPFFIAALIAYLLHPLVELLHKKGLHRGIAIVIIYLAFFGFTGYSIYLGIPVLIEQIKDLSNHLPAFAAQYRGWVDHVHTSTSRWPDGIQEEIDARIDHFEIWLNGFLAKVVNNLIKVLNYVFVLAVIPFISFYLLKDYELVKRSAWYLTPKKWRKGALHFLKDVDVTIGGYIRGQLLVCLIISIMSAAAFWLMGMKYPILLGAVIGITDIIPYFGPFIGAGPAVIIAATISGKFVVYVIIVIFVLQFLEGNLLSPFIVGRSLHMHPLFIILALLLGESFGGVIGLILAVPLMAVIRVLIIHLKNHFIIKRTQIDKR
jgi:predicted PurR-regulated permease PerM